MKPSLILRTSAPLLLWLPLAVSVYVLLRGHNEPGGGFVGGLIAACGILFFAVARGADAAERKLMVSPIALAAGGVLLATLSGLPGLLGGGAFLTHLWAFLNVGTELPVGTTLIFDIGVYATVIGVAATIFLALLRWQDSLPADDEVAAPEPSPAREESI